MNIHKTKGQVVYIYREIFMSVICAFIVSLKSTIAPALLPLMLYVCNLANICFTQKGIPSEKKTTMHFNLKKIENNDRD